MNGVDVSDCSHEEAVKRFLEAKEPIVVEVKRRNSTFSTTTVNTAQHSDDHCQRACQDEKQSYQPPSSSISREAQTEVDCLCYPHNYNKSDENLIFPYFEYEVMICKYGFSSLGLKIIMVTILQREKKINFVEIIDLVHLYYFDHFTFFFLSEKFFVISLLSNSNFIVIYFRKLT